jgi:hypothetical protein
VARFAEEIDAFEEYHEEAVAAFSCGEVFHLVSPFSVLDGPLEDTFLTWFLCDFPVQLIEPGELSEEDFPAPLALWSIVATKLSPKSDRTQAIRALLNTPFTLYRTVSVRPGESIVLHDIMLDAEVTVLDRTASRILSPGLIIYSKVLTFDDLSILFGTAHISLAPIYLDPLMRVRDALQAALEPEQSQLTRDHIIENDGSLRRWFLTLADTTANPKRPILHNTDGDLMEPKRLTYTHSFTDLMVAAEQIRTAVTAQPDENPPIEVVTKDPGHNPTEIMIPWIAAAKPGSAMSTILFARCVLTAESLTVHVNSAGRANSAREILASAMGPSLVFSGEQDEAFNIDSAITGAVPRELPDRIPPEVKEVLKRHLKQYEDSWLTTAIPALRGMTPREASQDPSAQPLLQALLDDMALRSKSVQREGVACFDVEELRARLGLAELS